MIFISLLLHSHKTDLIPPSQWSSFMGQTKHRMTRTARLKSWLKKVLHQILTSFEDSGLVHYSGNSIWVDREAAAERSREAAEADRPKWDEWARRTVSTTRGK